MSQFVRQQDLVPMARLGEQRIAVIGVGAVGRTVAMQLAAIGARDVTIIDHDTIDATNVVTQGFAHDDIGAHKVHAVERAMHQINPDMYVMTMARRFSKGLLPAPNDDNERVIFVCVDSITVRKEIWDAVSDVAPILFDTRMLGETIRVLSVTQPADYGYYPTTLFAQAEAQTGRCTARSTIYAAQIAAGLAVHQFTRWLRGTVDTDQDLMFNLLASELTVGNMAAVAG